MRFSEFFEAKIQWETDEFKNWFGNSVVKDKEGNPLRLYTGTSKDKEFNTFRPGRAQLIWFTISPEAASEYATDNESQGHKYGWDEKGHRTYERTNTASRVIPVYLKIENHYIEHGGPVHPDFKAQSQYILGKMRGHDGYIDSKNQIYVIKNPAQIKSATGNFGTFNPKSKDIRR